MKVKLAVQLLSKSVADALDFCEDTLKIDDFLGSKATSEFLRLFNDIFDVLNSRKISEIDNKKKALCKENFIEIQQFALNSIKYISELKFQSGELVIESTRKVDFIGIISGLRNISILYHRFIATEELKYLPLYKINQDHLELFFGSIRINLGRNNNPSVRHFISAYKKLLIRCEIRERGN